MADQDDRPNPDALLANMQRQEAEFRRGRLKVFLGMAAGVGKTYAMLEEARVKAAEGVDVVVGYAEPHIRPDTEAVLLGLEILPYSMVEYRGSRLKELDLDAAIARKPALLLVDELAHSNAPGMRHPKRWQDVAELLDAGINVYTTLNVQHLESVNDIVERVTGVKVRETLPDVVLEQADEVELVDIAPEELLERFRAGKVYRPDQVERAAKHFFTKGNLIALRELALRQTAQRVDAQMQDFRRENAIRSTWPATERVLVCVSPSPMSRRLVRAAKRLATGLHADWVAAYVETPTADGLSTRDRLRVEGTVRLAGELGATTVTLSGTNVANEIVTYAKAHNVTKIVIGKPDRLRWREVFYGSVVDDLIRHSGRIDVHVIHGDAEGNDVESEKGGVAAVKRDWAGWAWAVASVGLATAAGWPLHHHFGLSNVNVLMLYLLAVLVIATRFGRGAAILASALGVAAFDFCFVPPYLTLSVSDREYGVTFASMLATALVISTLTHRVRAQAGAARDRERRTAALLSLSRELASVRTTEEIAAATARQVADVLGGQVLVMLADGDKHLLIKGGQAPSGGLDDKEAGAARWAFEHKQKAGRGTNTLPSAAGTYVPVGTVRGTLGVLGFVASATAADQLSPEQHQVIEAFASQMAVALERAAAADEARHAWERVEAEFLRNTLLSGVSHELRTPLAAITGAATTLVEGGEAVPAESRSEMLETIQVESERMERTINNLLDMTRLESGGLQLNREWHSLQEIIGTALRRLDRRLHGRDITVRVPDDVPLVMLDDVAIEQVMMNLLENAVEYTPPESPIEISVRVDGPGIVVAVADRGPGIRPGTEKRIFDKFVRLHPSESRRGIGLGLAICRGIVEAHGGRIAASNRPGGGATFEFVLPNAEPPPAMPDH